jgi:hypothetical protein
MWFNAAMNYFVESLADDEPLFSDRWRPVVVRWAESSANWEMSSTVQPDDFTVWSVPDEEGRPDGELLVWVDLPRLQEAQPSVTIGSRIGAGNVVRCGLLNPHSPNRLAAWITLDLQDPSIRDAADAALDWITNAARHYAAADPELRLGRAGEEWWRYPSSAAAAPSEYQPKDDA